MNMNIHFRTKGIPGRYRPGQFTTDSIREHIRNLFPNGPVGQSRPRRSICRTLKGQGRLALTRPSQRSRINAFHCG